MKEGSLFCLMCFSLYSKARWLKSFTLGDPFWKLFWLLVCCQECKVGEEWERRLQNSIYLCCLHAIACTSLSFRERCGYLVSNIFLGLSGFAFCKKMDGMTHIFTLWLTYLDKSFSIVLWLKRIQWWSVTVFWYPDTSSRFIENLPRRVFLLVLDWEREKFQPLLLRNICSLLHQTESGLLVFRCPLLSRGMSY